MITVRVQAERFDVAAQTTALTADRADVGAVATFTGHVRGGDVMAMTLEHYPGMTEAALHAIGEAAMRRWPLIGLTIVHRVGRMLPGDPIVLVVAASAHRHAAFEAAAYAMDRLKTDAPFWKKEETAKGSRWVEARDSDTHAAARWAGQPERSSAAAESRSNR